MSDEEESDEIEEGTPLVCDNGSGRVKCGFAGQDAPNWIFPAIVGKPRHRPIMMAPGQLDVFVGEDAMAKRGILSLKYPIEHGIVTDWNAMEEVWRYMFEDVLRRDPTNQPILMSEAPLNPEKNRNKMAEIMFESFQVPAWYVQVQGALALYAAGKITGLVLDSGDGLSHAVPIYDGYALPHAIRRVNMGGRDLTFYMARLLGRRGVELASAGELQVAREIKEKCCHVSMDYDGDIGKCIDGTYEKKIFELPDGQEIEMDKEAFQCPEILFKPEIVGRDPSLGIHQMMVRSVHDCEMDPRRELLENVVLCGGTTMFKNLPERLQKEMTEATNRPVKILAPPERMYTVWIGGSIMSQLAHFQDQLITKEEYEEHGARLIQQRCF